jgi:branched-chain amino acid transport system ATP-binding protein
MGEPLLAVEGLTAAYGPTQVLFGVSLEVAAGETVTVVGRNGAGRSTLIKAIAGRVARRGSIKLAGDETAGLPAFRVAQAGVGYVPESREIFADLTVEENLLLGEPAARRPEGAFGWSIAQSYELFPRLDERASAPAGVLSGGEQQMLAFARALMGCPRLLLVDEPTEGLSPLMVKLMADTLVKLRDAGLSILLVEQKLDIALDIAARVYVLGHGEIVFSGSPAELRGDDNVRRAWIEV